MLPTSHRSRALAAGAALVGAVMVFVLVKACASGGSDLAPMPDGDKRPEPVSFSDEPLWDERKLGMTRVAGVELRGDLAVVAGDVGIASGARLAVVDVRTGRPHWVVDTRSPLKGGGGAEAHHSDGFQAEHLRGVTGDPLVYGDGDDWTVLIQYTKGPEGDETEIGVAALSGKDGSVRWKHALIRPGSGDKGRGVRDQKVRLLAADAQAVLTSVEGKEGIDPKTFALDPATGKTLWENEDGWAYRFAGGVVLGETRGSRGPSTEWGQERKGTDVFALDVKTGAKRWDLSEAFESSHLDAVAADTAVVDVWERKPGRTYENRRTLLLDAATGRETGRVGETGQSGGSGLETADDGVFGCEDDGGTLIACAGSGGRLVTIRPGDGEGQFISRRPPFDEDSAARVSLVWQDRIFVEASSSGDRPIRRAVVDRAGNRIGEAPIGEAAAMSEKAVAFRVERKGPISAGLHGLVVHAAAAGAEPPEPSGSGAPALAAPRIDATPLWTALTSETPPEPAPASGKKTGLDSVLNIRLAGDALVLTGEDADDPDLDRQVVVDVATGKVRWSIREGASLGGGTEVASMGVPHIVRMGDEWWTYLEYRSSGGVQGVAALSLKDGSVRWKKRTMGGIGYSLVRAADEKTFAVIVSKLGAREDEMVVYAAGTRKELWRKRGLRPESTGGGLVLAAESGPAGDRPVRPRDLIAYGAQDGERRWRLGGRYPEPRLLHDEGGETIVVGTADGGAVLDRATGRELARTHVPLSRCDGDGDTLIVCHGGPDVRDSSTSARAVTIQTRDGTTRILDLLETGVLTRYGALGDWFVAMRPETTGPRGQAERFLVLDGDGRLLSDDLPGMLRAIGGGFAVLTPSATVRNLGEGVATFTVHRVHD